MNNKINISDQLNRFLTLFHRVDLRDIKAQWGLQSDVTGALPQLTNLLPIIGYAVLLASLADLLIIPFPLKLQDAAWELQTLGALVENCWGLLIAIALVLSRYLVSNQDNIRAIELGILRVIRWLVLTLAILYIFAVPLILVDTARVHRTIQSQTNMADAARLAQLQQISGQVEQVYDVEVLRSIGQSIGLKLENESLPDLKQAIQAQLSSAQANIESQVQATRQEQSQQLFKSSFRTLYSGLIISFAFCFIWSSIGKFNSQF